MHQKKKNTQKTSTDKHAAEVKCKAVDRGTQSKCVFGWQRLTGQTLIFTAHWDRKNICWIMHTQPLTYSHIDTHLQMTSVTFYSKSGWKHIHTVFRTSSVPPDYRFSKLHWASEFFSITRASAASFWETAWQKRATQIKIIWWEPDFPHVSPFFEGLLENVVFDNKIQKTLW